MSNIFFTSDHHFHHENIIKLCNRPFKDLDEMHDEMIQRWNSVVGKSDTVYHLGDLTLGNKQDASEILSRLNGLIYIIKGNHDKRWYGYNIYGSEIRFLPPIHLFMHDGLRLVLSHYPLREWEGYWRGYGHIYGHVHGNLPAYGKSFDIGVDDWDFEPVPLETVVSEFSKFGN